MGQIKDLTGQKFGKLTVLEMTNERRNRQVVWKCQCECGNITYVVGQALRTGHTTTCGCSWREKKAEDLSGKTFGKLTVIKRSDKINLTKHVYWDCVCECGNTRIVDGTSLRNKTIFDCQECANKRRYGENYQKKVHEKRMRGDFSGPIKDLSKQKFGNLTPLELLLDKRDNAGHAIWRCKCDCGKIIDVASNRLTTYNTTSCGCVKTSIGEKIIMKILNDNNINYETQYSFKDCLSPKNKLLFFDFAIFDSNKNLIKLIEYDGKQHFEPVEYFGGEQGFITQQEYDQIKNQYCKEHNIELIRIPYTLNKKLITKELLKL